MWSTVLKYLWFPGYSLFFHAFRFCPFLCACNIFFFYSIHLVDALLSLLPGQDWVLGNLFFCKQLYIPLALYSHESIYIRILLDVSDRNLTQTCIVRRRKMLAYVTRIRRWWRWFYGLNVTIRVLMFFLSLYLLALLTPTSVSPDLWGGGKLALGNTGSSLSLQVTTLKKRHPLFFSVYMLNLMGTRLSLVDLYIQTSVTLAVREQICLLIFTQTTHDGFPTGKKASVLQRKGKGNLDEQKQTSKPNITLPPYPQRLSRELNGWLLVSPPLDDNPWWRVGGLSIPVVGSEVHLRRDLVNHGWMSELGNEWEWMNKHAQEIDESVNTISIL